MRVLHVRPPAHLGDEGQGGGHEVVRAVPAPDDDQPRAGVGVDHSKQQDLNLDDKSSSHSLKPNGYRSSTEVSVKFLNFRFDSIGQIVISRVEL